MGEKPNDGSEFAISAFDKHSFLLQTTPSSSEVNPSTIRPSAVGVVSAVLIRSIQRTEANRWLVGGIHILETGIAAVFEYFPQE
jgi:hypothetical protein